MLFDTSMTQADQNTLIALTLQQAADRLGCSKGHIYRLINSGALPSCDISAPGSLRTKQRILLDDLNDYVSARRSAT